MQYFIQVVPTIYEKSSGNLYDTNQYSVTYQHAEVDLKSEHIELPGKPPSVFSPLLLSISIYSILLILSNQIGLFFKYDISPIMINIREEYTPFTKFLTRSLAMMGGVWVVLGLVYSLTVNAFTTVVKKLE